jgi:hypothetical protein
MPLLSNAACPSVLTAHRVCEPRPADKPWRAMPPGRTPGTGVMVALQHLFLSAFVVKKSWSIYENTFRLSVINVDLKCNDDAADRAYS